MSRAMGKNNRQRRAAKARERAKARARERHREQAAGSGPTGFGPHGLGCGCPIDDESSAGWSGRPSERDRVEDLYHAYVHLAQSGRASEAEGLLAELAERRAEVVAGEIERDLARILPALWGAGWLPGEVLRQARRGAGAVGERVAARAVSADHGRRHPSTLDPRWRDHVDGLGLPVLEGGARVVLSDEVGRARPRSKPASWPDVVRAAADVAVAWYRLGPLEAIIPPPGSETVGGGGREPAPRIDLTRQVSDPMLDRVRQLLAQAESTTFDAEAESFTAKAQELMAKHAIDAALVWDRHDRSDEPISMRVPIDDPYAQPKQLLMGVVASENGCRAVIDDHHGLVHLVGFAGDLAWVETLFTSLLVQAQRELARVGAAEPAGGRRRGRGFRASFLAAYADRIGERLAEVNAAVRDGYQVDAETVDRDGGGGAEGGGRGRSALVPVLEDRSDAVDDATDRLFGRLGTTSFRGGSDWLGWHEGRQAAERADLQPTVTG